MKKKGFKILSVGNSFSDDTMKLTADIATSLGLTEFKFANLYIGGCSIKRHYNNATNDLADYTYYTNVGNGWNITENYSISQAVKEEKWDFISIQHGTGDKSRYTSPECYDNLVPLIEYIKSHSNNNVKIAFNMTWIADEGSQHHEFTSYGCDQMLMYKRVAELTKNLIAPISEIDVISPTGTAVQNARPYVARLLTRDNYHLSLDLGRYIAGLTFLKALCGLDISKVDWKPETVSDEEKLIAIKAAEAAVTTPYEITKIC